MNDVMGIVYTSKDNLNLRELTTNRAVAALPVAGRYRIIDFTLSNLVNSGVRNVGVIVQKNYHSLMDHLGSGKEWDLHGKNDGLYVLPPFLTRENVGVYSGMLDALRSNTNYLSRSKQEYLVLSGEQSGHIIFLEHMTTGDGQLAALQFLSILTQTGKRASELVQDIPRYPQVLINVKVGGNAAKTAIMQSQALKAEIAAAEGLLAGDGRVLVRASGTEPLIRVMVEAGSEAAAAQTAQRLVKAVENLQKNLEN